MRRVDIEVERAKAEQQIAEAFRSLLRAWVENVGVLALRDRIALARKVTRRARRLSDLRRLEARRGGA